MPTKAGTSPCLIKPMVQIERAKLKKLDVSMLKTTLAASAVAFALTQAAFAETAEDLAHEYVSLPQMQQMMEDMFSPGNMAAQFAAGLPPDMQLTNDQLQRIGVILSGSMQSMKPRLESVMIELSAEMFSEDELRALIAFYSSEHGASVMAKMSPFMQQAMARIGPDLEQRNQQDMAKIIKIIREQN